MPFVYITGPAGSGRSSVQSALSNLGYEAHDVDDPTIGAPHNTRTGKIVQMPPVNQRTLEWFSNHSWKMLPTSIDALKVRSADRLVFLCGTAANERDFWLLYDYSFYLDIDETSLRERITDRHDNDYGKTDFELQRILDLHRANKQTYVELGATIIDATMPLKKVVEVILQNSSGK